MLHGMADLELGTFSEWASPNHMSPFKAEGFLWLLTKEKEF